MAVPTLATTLFFATVVVVAGAPLLALKLGRSRVTASGVLARVALIGVPASLFGYFVGLLATVQPLTGQLFWFTESKDSARVMLALGLAVAALLGAIMLGHGLWIRGEMNRFRRRVGSLASAGSAKEEEARAIEVFLLERMPRAQAPPSAYAGSVLVAVRGMLDAGCVAQGEDLLRVLPDAWLSSTQRSQVGLLLAFCRLKANDLAGARKALGRIPEPSVDAAVEEARLTLRARLHAAAGEAAEALAIVGDGDDAPCRITDRLSALTARAHAFAALGEDERAREALFAVKSELGAARLDEALLPEGPASRLARGMKGDAAAPYR